MGGDRKGKKESGWEQRGGKGKGNRSTRCARGEEINMWSNNFDDRPHRIGGFFMRKS